MKGYVNCCNSEISFVDLGKKMPKDVKIIYEQDHNQAPTPWFFIAVALFLGMLIGTLIVIF